MHTTYTGERVRLRPFRSGEEVYYISCVVHNRANPYFLFFDNEGDLLEGSLESQAKQVSLFPILTSVSWNFAF